jgi:CPA1 family monovalent cation:H+ antiporter
MQNLFSDYIYLILIIIGLIMLANKLRIAYPIILVLGGLALSFAKTFSHITIDPELIFFIFLPPLLYEAAWQTSWKEFWKWRRIITSFAFPIVIITSCVVAFASNAIIPGFTLALGFLLGGIVSPPDAVSATTILRQVNAPKRLISIAEGESLLNDASSLIVFRFALAAIITGQFHIQEAAASFVVVIGMGTFIGVVIGFIFYSIHRWLPTTSSIEIVLTLVTPYCMYYAAEYFHFSGVLAVVAGGLLLSSKRQTMLNYRSRLESVNVWSSFVFVLNGLIFFLIGLQLPSVTRQLGDIGIGKAIAYGLSVSLVLIIVRLASAFGASVFTRFMSRFITVADASPGWKVPMIFGWAGMRGVVSLAAAFSIPLYVNQQPFPHRNLILFITFIVILVTLVLQGLTLPWVIRKVNVEDADDAIPELEQEKIIQKKMAHYSLQFLEEKYGEHLLDNEHFNNLKTKLRSELDYFNRLFETQGHHTDHSLRDYHNIYLELLNEQRKILNEMNQKAEFDEDIIRKYHSLIDIEELKVREKKLDI